MTCERSEFVTNAYEDTANVAKFERLSNISIPDSDSSIRDPPCDVITSSCQDVDQLIQHRIMSETDGSDDDSVDLRDISSELSEIYLDEDIKITDESAESIPVCLANNLDEDAVILVCQTINHKAIASELSSLMSQSHPLLCRQILERKYSVPRIGRQMTNIQINHLFILEKLILKKHSKMHEMVKKKQILENVKNGQKPLYRPAIDDDMCDEAVIQMMKKCWSEEPMERPDFQALKSIIRKLNKDNESGNILDNLLSRMEQYANNLEALVQERTADYFEEKRKAEELLYQLLPKRHRSTVDHLVRFETLVREAFIRREHLAAVFFDLEKAYETTWKYGILRDLFNSGLRGRGGGGGGMWGNNSPVSQYWSIVLHLELLLNVYVRSLRQASFTMYLDALTELACWFHAMDHMNYARWIPVHLKDMSELPERHPEVARKFREGSFTVQKTKKISSIAIDQAHEQNNACIKGDGGAVGLTDNPAALRRWMIAGPEVARVIKEVQHGNQHSG
ncbi:Atrial natriuretic peptide receptor 2 [Nymphon striatum]|nr:Atrial natriuretic peptide receptor 2 [Nymphon striatum]